MSKFDLKMLEFKCIEAVKTSFLLFFDIKYSPTKFIIEKQLIRSISSIGANLIEGSGAVSRKEWLNYMNISRKSALESEYWLRVLSAVNIVRDHEKFEQLKIQISELAKIFTSIVKSGKK